MKSSAHDGVILGAHEVVFRVMSPPFIADDSTARPALLTKMSILLATCSTSSSTALLFVISTLDAHHCVCQYGDLVKAERLKKFLQRMYYLQDNNLASPQGLGILCCVLQLLLVPPSDPKVSTWHFTMLFKIVDRLCLSPERVNI